MTSPLRRDFARAAVRVAFSAIAVGAAFGAVAAAQAQAIESAAVLNHQTPVPQNNPFTLFLKTSEILAGGIRDRDRVAATSINVQAQNWNAGGDKITPSRGAPKL